MFRIILFLCALLSSCHKQDNILTKHTVRVGVQTDPSVLDSRCARDLTNCGVIRMLFEGLMRPSKEGQVEPALLKALTISDDHRTYTFSLKKTFWSNGDPVTSFDFAFAWKSILDPQFATDIAQHLYPIKNARLAKLGEISLDAVGIQARDAQTLIVELEHPTPYFLELLAMTPFFPVPKDVVMRDTSWAQHEETLVSNGPFCLEKRRYTEALTLQKNPLYWQEEIVQLDGIELCVVSPDTGLLMFEEKKLDWMGSPLSTIPPDAVATLKTEELLHASPFCATSFCRLNTHETILDKPNPLANTQLRRALSLALNRQEIVDHILQGGQTAATRFVPPEMGLHIEGCFADNAIAEAKEILSTIETPKEPLVIQYCQNERNALIAQALQRQWQEHLGLQIDLEAIEAKFFYKMVSSQEFSIALGSWTADFNDPLNFLDVFKFQNNGLNNTGWENREYIDLLDRSAVCDDMLGRSEILRQAEQILLHDMPIIPIYHFALNYVQNEALEGAYVSSQGYLDLRWAKF